MGSGQILPVGCVGPTEEVKPCILAGRQEWERPARALTEGSKTETISGTTRVLNAFQQSSEAIMEGWKALRAQEVALSSLWPPSVPVNPAACLILITDYLPWSNYSGLLLPQFAIYLAVSSWLSPQFSQFVFIEHLLCLKGWVCPGGGKDWCSSLQGLQGSW